jgi:hypothetical protein
MTDPKAEEVRTRRKTFLEKFYKKRIPKKNQKLPVQVRIPDLLLPVNPSSVLTG